ncbi:mitogen-activated protein kinase kinase kinase 5-like [Gastrolobium bilobum]|uniref:mitogen-activated protein kinase kinase kinase 5-like n=1 Tax=Gastrolobium bilobum TaxID=150636 RepID=UPI002AAF4717|nr:mitogen-activated protein kinase kinase kinase 5-like [Gastrolobium bilobum]
MRWLHTLISSHSSSSSSSSSATLGSSPSFSSLPDPKKKPSSDATTHRGGAWLFGSGRKSTRSRKLRHVGDNDARWHHDSDDVNVVPLSRSPSCFVDRSYNSRSNTSSVAPQPLPLPELSSPALHRQRDGECRLPSPKDAAGPTDRVDGSFDGVTSGFRMRSVFASQETRRNMEQVETIRSPRTTVRQETSGSGSRRRDSFTISVPARSAPNSPFASPTISPTNGRNMDDFVQYYYVTPKANQFWSAPEMATSLSGLPPPAFFDLSALGNDRISPHQSPRARSPNPNPKSPTRASSPLPRLSLETPTTRRETIAPLTVHPLPLPPWPNSALLPSPSATFSPTLPKTESLSMKSQWQKGKLIGRGTFGSVYVATNRETGALCAMKEAEIFSDDPKSAECIKQLEQEIKVLSHLKHPNIVQYYGSEIVEDKFYIYLEYIHPGSINKYVREHCGAITESVVRNFTRHIVSGLAYLHSKKTIHRDIKGANLLVDSAGVVKLADFGMAKHLTGHDTNLSLKGSPYWMAPELMQAVMQKDNSSDLAFAVDIWSLGCTIIEMFTGKPPWSEYEGAAAMFKVMRDTPPIPETLSSEGKDFLRLCFKRNPAERPTASMLLDHRFLKNLQQSDVSSSTQPYNGNTLMDKPHSPRVLPENKPDQISIPSVQIAKGKSATDRFFSEIITNASGSNEHLQDGIYCPKI